MVPSVRQRPIALIAIGAVLAAWIVTRILLFSRFPWFIDETLFASHARVAEAFPDQRFIALTDKEGLLSSWISAVLIGRGVEPLTAVRLLSGIGTLVSAVGLGWLLLARKYALTVAVTAGGLVLLGPFFLVHASIGIYDPLICGLTTLAVCLMVLMARTLRLDVALLLAATLGAGLLIKDTIVVALLLLPMSAMAVDRARRRALWRWLMLAALATASAFVIAQIARLSPLYYAAGPDNHKALGDIFDGLGPRVDKNLPDLLRALVGYLTLPGLALAVAGAVVGWRRDRVLTSMLVVWLAAPLASTLLLPYSAFPRYFTTSIPPFAALVAIGAVAGAQALHALLRPRGARLATCAVAAAAVAVALPALLFDARVLLNPAGTRYPGLDDEQYVTAWSAVEPAHVVAAAIRERSPGRGIVTVATIGTRAMPYELLLNPGRRVPIARFSLVDADPPASVPPQARFVVVDNSAPVPAGFRQVVEIRRPRGGTVMGLYQRAG